MTKTAPRITVILITPDRFQTIRKSVAHLRAQTIADDLELIITCPSRADLEPVENELEGFRSVRIIETGPVRSIGKCYGAGVRVAGAPVVACGEEHSFPAPDWAEVLLERHEEDWACVGPDIQPANPLPMMCWSQLFMNYAPCVGHKNGCEVNSLLAHNATYKTSILLDYYKDDELDRMLDSENVMYLDLRRRGHRLFVEPRARLLHLNVSKNLSYLGHCFHGGRQFGSARSRNWGVPRRLLYIAGSPLIPLVRLYRVIPEIWRSEHRKRLLPMLPSLTIGLIIQGMGEAVSYAAGAGESGERILEYQFHRYRHITARDMNYVYGGASTEYVGGMPPR